MADFGDQNKTTREINVTLGQINQKLSTQLEYQLLIAEATGNSVDDIREQARGLGASLDRAERSSGRIGSTVDSLAGSAGKVFDVLGKPLGIASDAIDAVDTLTRYHSEQFLKILDDFGGGIDFINNATTLESQQMVDTTQRIISQFYDFSDEAVKIQGSSLFTIFENSEQMMESFYKAVADRGTEAYDLLRSSNENIALDMALTQKELGFNQQQLETLIAREVDLTGEATGQMLREVVAFSNAVGKETGIASKRIAGNIELIIRDTERFGNVSTSEASRISAALIEVGIRYEDLSGAVGKFQSYEDAATAVGNLTSVFGIHMDAMEMMELANTDQEQFLVRMREQLLGAGKDWESMTIAEKNLLKTQLGFQDIGAVERFLDPSNVVTSFEDLQAASDPSLIKDNLSEMVESIRPMDNASRILERFNDNLLNIASKDMAKGLADTRLELARIVGVSTGELVNAGSEALEEYMSKQGGQYVSETGELIEERLAGLTAAELETSLDHIKNLAEAGEAAAADVERARIDSIMGTSGALQRLQGEIGELDEEKRSQFDDTLRYIEERTREGVNVQGSAIRDAAITLAAHGRDALDDLISRSDDITSFTEEQLGILESSDAGRRARAIRSQADFASEMLDIWISDQVRFDQLNESAINDMMEKTGLTREEISSALAGPDSAETVVASSVGRRTQALLGAGEEAVDVGESEMPTQGTTEVISRTAEAVTSAMSGRPINITVELDSRILADAIIQNPVGTDNITIVTSQIS